MRIFLLFARHAFRITMQSRFGVIFFLIGKVVRFAFMFFLLYFIFSKTRVLKGYTFQQAALFYLVYNQIDTTAQILFRRVYSFRPLVVSGALDSILLRPYHPFLYVLVGGVDILDLILLVPYTLLSLFFLFHDAIALTHLVGFMLLVLNALWITTSFHIIVLSLGILTTEVDHTIMIYRDITGMGRFPIAIYQEPIRTIFTFIVPVGVMMSFPPQALFGLLSLQGYLYAFVLSSVLCVGSLHLWNMALRRYQSWGG